MRTRPYAVLTACVMLVFAALAGAEGMTLRQIAQLQSVGSVAISPSGDRIAYTLTVQRELVVEDDGPAWSELHVIEADGTHRPFITGEVNVGSIAWTPLVPS